MRAEHWIGTIILFGVGFVGGYYWRGVHPDKDGK